MGFDWSAYKGDRFKFTEAGMSVEGTVAGLSATDFGDGPVPVVAITTADAGTVEVTCSQRVLQMRLAELAPQMGDKIRITYDGEDHAGARPGRSPAKLFTVLVKHGAEPTPPAAAPPISDEWGDEPF
jgi:hypothetical protein